MARQHHPRQRHMDLFFFVNPDMLGGFTLDKERAAPANQRGHNAILPGDVLRLRRQ